MNAHVNLPKVAQFDQNLIHYSHKPPTRVSLLKLLARQKENLEEMSKFRDIYMVKSKQLTGSTVLYAKKKILLNSEVFLKTLASNLTIFWKHNKLDLRWEAIAELKNCEPKFYESFIRNKAYAHHQCGS